jgi:ubiquitin carboxyl-terminal hydrolase L5
MNNEDKLDLGQDLLELKNFTRQMDPYMKGLSISNSEKIRLEHNKFSRPEPFVFTQKKKAKEEDEVFHFVAYLNFKDSVYEIDGLREGPILIEEKVSSSDWIEKVKPAIINRINLYASNEIKFNLLAVVPDRRFKAQEKEKEIHARVSYINSLLQGSGTSHLTEKFLEYDSVSKDELMAYLSQLEYELENNRMVIDEENMKFEKYRVREN